MDFEIENGVLKKYIPEDGEEIVIVPESVTEIDKSVFYKGSMKEIVLPDTLKKINSRAFEHCINLEKINLPNNVTSWGEYILLNCISLKEIIMPNWEEIPRHCFMNCFALERVQIPENVKKIGAYAFSGCIALKEVIFPEQLEYIAPSAFYQCENLVSVRITADKLGEDAFSACQNLKQVEFSRKTLDVIRPGCFSRCGFQEITLPPVGLIDDYAFDSDVILHIQRSDGVFTMRFGKWEFHQNERNLLKFLSDSSYNNETYFQEIKNSYYKLMLAYFMIQNHPEEEFYQKYIKRNIKKIIKELTDLRDVQGIQKLLETGYITKKNIDELITYAIDTRQHEIQILLMNWKNDNIPVESIETQVQKKFRL